MADLSVDFAGLKLKNPFIIASSELTNKIDKIKVAEENGADLVLLGGFEYKGLMRDALSRQHREILKNAKCSILVVREPEIDAIYQKL